MSASDLFPDSFLQEPFGTFTRALQVESEDTGVIYQTTLDLPPHGTLVVSVQMIDREFCSWMDVLNDAAPLVERLVEEDILILTDLEEQIADLLKDNEAEIQDASTVISLLELNEISLGITDEFAGFQLIYRMPKEVLSHLDLFVTLDAEFNPLEVRMDG